jgi:xylulokinase
VILTIDMGTSATKAALWDEDGIVGAGRAFLSSVHGAGGTVEQDPASWWPSVVDACTTAGEVAGSRGLDAADAVVFASARQTFVPVTAGGEPLGRALMWSDRRAVAEATRLAAKLGGVEIARNRTGGILDGAAVAAKLAWLAAHQRDRLVGSAWVLSPRDLVVRELTGIVATDVTLASAAGLYDGDLQEVPELAGPATGKLPEVVDPDTVIGKVRHEQAAALGVRPGIPVVIGAGDRACEVLGTGAAAERPMVAWGTTANVSVPVAERPLPVPPGLTVTRGALGAWVLEGGLSAAGSLLAWVGNLTGIPVDELARQALDRPPGAGGVRALPWPGGARAPWWRDDASAGFVGLGLDHGPADLARAVLEAVAFDVARCLDAMGAAGVGPVGLATGGSAATPPAWIQVLTGVTGLPARRRRSGEAAMAGAALVASTALGAGLHLDRLDPVETESRAAAEEVRRYAALRRGADSLAAGMIGLGLTEPDVSSRLDD